MQVHTPRWSASCALTALIIFYMASGLPYGPSSGAPSVLDVYMESNTATVNASYNETSVPVTFNGTIRTNYPGVSVDVYIQASCGNFPAAASPWHIQMRGIDIRNFSVTVTITKGFSINTTCIGPLSVLARTAYSEDVFQTSVTLAIHVEWTVQPINSSAYPEPPEELNASMDGQGQSSDLGLALLVLPPTIAFAFAYLLKLRRSRRTGTKRRS